MLDHLGLKDASNSILTAVSSMLVEPSLRTKDLGGKANTKECGKAVTERLI